MDLNNQLLTLLGEYLKGTLTLHHVENWLSAHEAADFRDWQADLFRTLELDLAEIGSGGLTEGELQAHVRELLAKRPMPEMVVAYQDLSPTSSVNTVFVVGRNTPLSAPARSIWRTVPQTAYA